MKIFGRRDFLKAAMAAGGAAGLFRIVPGAWMESAHAASPGFFESEFGIADALCRKSRSLVGRVEERNPTSAKTML